MKVLLTSMDTSLMSIASKITNWWENLKDWISNPIATFEKMRKSPWTLMLMIFFLAQPVISLYVSTAQDIGWIKHKIDPSIESNYQRINDLEKRVNVLEAEKEQQSSPKTP